MKRWIPVSRLQPILREWRGSDEFLGQNLARKIGAIRNSEQEYVSEELADELLSALDMNEWWQIPAEKGGLADIYLDGKQYGGPRRHEFTSEERSAGGTAKHANAARVLLTCPECGATREVRADYAMSKRAPKSCRPCANRMPGKQARVAA